MASSTAMTGYNATLTLGTYVVASLKNVSLTRSGEVLDLSNLSSKMTGNAYELRDWELTGERNVSTEKFLGLMASTVRFNTSAAKSLLVTLKDPTGASTFKGTGWITAASLDYPMGGAGESITITGTGRYTSVLK
jgi:hypothetical protein